MASRNTSRKPRDDGQQSQRFIRTARELGCDEDPEAFKRVLRNIARHKPLERREKQPQSKDHGER